MAAAPSSEDYDVLDEEVLAPDGANTATVGSKAPAPAPGPSADDEDSGANTIVRPTHRSLVAAVVFAVVCAVAPS